MTGETDEERNKRIRREILTDAYNADEVTFSALKGEACRWTPVLTTRQR